MEDGSDEAKRKLTILRLMGLFDRPADADCVGALLEEPAIPGLTDPTVGLMEGDWNSSLDALETARFLSVSRERSGELISLDAHPLLREYSAWELRTPTGRNKPAQGNALGSGIPISGSPEGATQGTDVPPLQGVEVTGTAVPGALPQAGFSRPVGAEPGTETSEAWRAAHRRLYIFLRDRVPWSRLICRAQCRLSMLFGMAAGATGMIWRSEKSAFPGCQSSSTMQAAERLSLLN